MQNDIVQVINEIKKVIVGKDEILTKILTAIFADGHILLDDVPGVGKTTLAMATGKAMGLCCKRVQFTPDVLPSDITGFSVYSRDSGALSYVPGAAAGANILLGDEINRTSSKTQSALLEAMEERQVTVDGATHKLETPFIVIATQNNVGTSGTQLLPFAQLDRFLMRLSLGYPDLASQMAIIRDRQDGNPLDGVCQILTAANTIKLQENVRAVTLKDNVIEYIANLAHATRENADIELGVSPRGALFVARAAKAYAFINARDYVTPADVRAVFEDVCAHRIILSQAAKAGKKTELQVLQKVIADVIAPDGSGITA